MSHYSLHLFWLNECKPITSGQTTGAEIFSHPTACRSTILLTFHWCVCLQRGVFASCISNKILHTHHSYLMHTTCSSSSAWLVTVTSGGQYKSHSSSLHNFLHFPVSTYLSDRNKHPSRHIYCISLYITGNESTTIWVNYTEVLCIYIVCIYFK